VDYYYLTPDGTMNKQQYRIEVVDSDNQVWHVAVDVEMGKTTNTLYMDTQHYTLPAQIDPYSAAMGIVATTYELSF
jgi:hypothetical protein